MKRTPCSRFHDKWVLGVEYIFMSIGEMLWSFQQVSLFWNTVACTFDDFLFSSKNWQAYFVTYQVWISRNFNQFCMLISITKLPNKTFFYHLLCGRLIIEYLNWLFLRNSLIFIEWGLLWISILFVRLLCGWFSQWQSFNLVHNLYALS